jgi:succinate dehydrogenase/fumarate reductase flavoprotein subunit
VQLVVAGAGMGGLAAAARARELGAEVVVHEKGTHPGGSMLLSGGFIWRYREFERLRAECPGGDPALQRLVWERLDDALAWLESLGAPVTARDTGNPLTTGRRFDTAGLTETLAARAGEVRLDAPLDELPAAPLILATGGFQGDPELLREHVTPEADELVLRANPWSAGDGLRLGLESGARLTDGLDEFWGRAMPAPPARIGPQGFRPLGQSYARYAWVTNERGEQYEPHTWSEIDVAQWIAKQPRGRAWFAVPDAALGERVRKQTVAEMIEAARTAGAPVERRDGETVVEVVAGITTTLGGLAIDKRARTAERVWAVGADAGGISTGGWTSTLASALVLGLVAAEDAVG